MNNNKKMQFDTKSNIYNDDGYLTDGILIKYHYGIHDNIIAIAIEFRNNQMNGFYKTFNESGMIVSNRTYRNSFLHGSSYFYDENGNIIREVEYDDGKKINTRVFIPTEKTPEDPIPKRPRRRFSLSELNN